MISKTQKNIKKLSIFLLVLTLFFSLHLSAEETAKCERAHLKCMIDAVRSIPDFTSFYSYSIYCLSGYAFCIKYL